MAPPRLVGVISNPRSHHNRTGADDAPSRPGLLSAAPATRAQLSETLAGFAARGEGSAARSEDQTDLDVEGGAEEVVRRHGQARPAGGLEPGATPV